MLHAFDGCGVYPLIECDAESVPKLNAHVSWSLRRTLSPPPALCRRRVVHSSRSRWALKKAETLTITLEVFAASHFCPVCSHCQHLSTYTTLGSRSANRSLHSCDIDGAIFSERTPSCRPLTQTRRVPFSRDPPFTVQSERLIPPLSSMTIFGSADASQPGGIRHAGTRSPQGQACGLERARGSIRGNNLKGIAFSSYYRFPECHYFSSVVGPPLPTSR